MFFPHGTMVTLRSTVTTDDGLGNETVDVSELVWGPCAVAPRFATETTDPRVAPVVVGKTIYGPAVTIAADDTLLIDGVVWQVDGLPAEYVSPFTGWTPGIEVPVKRAG